MGPVDVQVPIPDHLDLYHLAEEVAPTDRTALETVSNDTGVLLVAEILGARLCGSHGGQSLVPLHCPAFVPEPAAPGPRRWWTTSSWRLKG